MISLTAWHSKPDWHSAMFLPCVIHQRLDNTHPAQTQYQMGNHQGGGSQDTRWHLHTLTLLHSHTATLSHCYTLTLLHILTLSFSHCYTLTLLHSHTILKQIQYFSFFYIPASKVHFNIDIYSLTMILWDMEEYYWAFIIFLYLKQIQYW